VSKVITVITVLASLVISVLVTWGMDTSSGPSKIVIVVLPFIMVAIGLSSGGK
jgi:hypothetical protein